MARLASDCLLNGFQDGIFGHLSRACLHHHDRLVGTGDDEVEVTFVRLGEGRVDDVAAVEASHSDGADGAAEGDIADHERSARADGDEGVGLVLSVTRESDGDDLYFVAESLGEKRPERTVGEPHGEDPVVACAAFASGKAPGDPADRVEALFVVHGEGEEVYSRPGISHADGDEHYGVAESHGDGAVRLLGHVARLDGKRFAVDLDLIRVHFHFQLHT